MATIVHSIGTFSFLTMTPAPPTRRVRSMVETRNGSDGFSIWKESIRGEAHQCQTVVDTGTFAAAQTLKALYEAACGGDKVPLIYAGVTYPDVYIKDVRANIRTQLIGIGGLNPPSQALLVATWQLLID